MKVAWATDVHFNAADEKRAVQFCREVKHSKAEALLIGGDIAEAPDLEMWLRLLARNLDQPIYFVLGNHDYYGASVRSVESCMRRISSPKLKWLPDAGVIPLTEKSALVGHGGWGMLVTAIFSTPP